MHIARLAGAPEITGLLSTLTAPFGRVSMHAVREDLARAQAQALGLPLHRVHIPYPCSDEQYADAMRKALAVAQAQGVTHVVFGDLFLEDVRKYREERLAQVGMHGVFPLWQRDTPELAAEMLAAGLKARITCLDPRKLPREFAGREFDERLLSELPAGVDALGENGEFHTFAYAGPMFASEIRVMNGEVVERDGFVFCDLLPA